MTLFLCLSLAASTLVLLLAYVMDAQAIQSEISGANGLPVFVALYLSGAATIPVLAVTAWVWGIPSALGIVVASGLWHYGMGSLLFGALQRQAAKMRQKRSL